jgi:TonB family protein
VRLSTDSIRAAAEPELSQRAKTVYDAPESERGPASTASDVWSLGITLVETLTQRAPAWDRKLSTAPVLPNLPEPFAEVARRCLQIDPQRRWSVREIAARLEPQSPKIENATPPAAAIVAGKKPSRLWYAAPLAAVALGVAIWGGARLLSSNAPGTPASEQHEAAASPANPSQPGQAAKQSAEGSEAAADSGPQTPPSDSHTSGVIHRVLPEISLGARRTIRGTIRVDVKVDVDPAGNVTHARLKSGGKNGYFARRAREASEGWKFAPTAAGTQRAWILRYGFSRKKTEISVETARP